MKKGKLTLTISIGCTALILTMIIFTQFKTVDKTDITAIETMRETELRTELADWKTKYEEIDEKILETENKINEYKTELSNNADSSKLLENEIIEKTFDQYKEQLKYYSVEKLKLSNVFSGYMLQTINKIAFDLGYEITIDKENELLEKIYIEFVKEEEKAC